MAMFGCCCAVQDNAFLELTPDTEDEEEDSKPQKRRFVTHNAAYQANIVQRPTLTGLSCRTPTGSSGTHSSYSRTTSIASSQHGVVTPGQQSKPPPRPTTYAQPQPAASAPEVPEGPQCFVATVEKPTADTPLGLHMDLSDMSVIHVAGLRAGLSPVSSYNESGQRGEVIRAGDYITKVNHIAGDAERMIEEIQAHKTLAIEIRRPVTFVATIPKDDQPMGFELNYAASAQSLVVDSVASGAVRDWGEEHPDREILTGDRIVSVCGKRGTAQELLHTIAKNSPVVLEISRPAAFG